MSDHAVIRMLDRGIDKDNHQAEHLKGQNQEPEQGELLKLLFQSQNIEERYIH